MRNQRSFSLEFKRQVVEELLSGESRPAQLSSLPTGEMTAARLNGDLGSLSPG